MNKPIVRMYPGESQAREAVRLLRQDGFADDVIFLVTPPADGESSSADAIAARIMAAFVLRSHANVYAQRVLRGHALVVVHTAFGFAQTAIDILESCGPVESGVETPRTPTMAWDEAAPLSSALRMPVLCRGEATPFSRVLGLPPLSRGRSALWMVFYGELGESKPTFSTMFGLPLLTRVAAPLSSLLGLRPLSAGLGDRERSFGMPLLARNPAPLSSLMGLPVLTGR